VNRPHLEGWYRGAIGAARLVTTALDFTTRVEGFEHLPRTGPVILAANHVAYPDFLPIGVAARERGRFVRFLCRHDVWNKWWCAYPMTRMRHVPVDPAAPAGAYLAARRLLREGHAVGAFPEAGISYSFTVRSLMPGVVALARETGVPVVPVVQWGIQRTYTRGRPVDGREPRPDWARGRLNDLRFGPALTVAKDVDITTSTRRLGATLTAMLEEVQQLPEHRPRPGEHAPWYPAHLGGHAPDRAEALDLDEVPRSAVSPTWGPSVLV
jgi:1-acyl-sn-glycerol-3-phosphate acyltransferase